MRNIIITATAHVSIPDNAIINENGTITINGEVIKDIGISISKYDTLGDCHDADVLKSEISIEDHLNDKEKFQTLF